MIIRAHYCYQQKLLYLVCWVAYILYLPCSTLYSVHSWYCTCEAAEWQYGSRKWEEELQKCVWCEFNSLRWLQSSPGPKNMNLSITSLRTGFEKNSHRRRNRGTLQRSSSKYLTWNVHECGYVGMLWSSQRGCGKIIEWSHDKWARLDYTDWS